MIFEDIMSNVFDMFTSGSVDFSHTDSYIGALATLLTYIDYFDPIVNVSMLLTCCGVILGWTILCVVIRLVIEFFT